MSDERERAWLAALQAAYRREDATEARTLVDWHNEHPEAPPPLRAATEPITAPDAANE